MLSVSSLRDLDIGDFENAEKRMQECLRIRSKLLPPEDENICNAYNNLNLACSSQGKYREGLQWLLKADSVRQVHGRDWSAKSLLMNVNLGRIYYCMRNYIEAQRHLDAARKEAIEADSWYWQIQ